MTKIIDIVTNADVTGPAIQSGYMKASAQMTKPVTKFAKIPPELTKKRCLQVNWSFL